MEAIFASSSVDHQSIYPHKQIKYQTKKNSRGPVLRSTENLAPTNSNNIHGGGGVGLLFAPTPSLSFSHHSSSSVFYPHQQIQRQSQPPLLPLPISRPHNSFPPSRTRDLSCPPTSRKTNRTRDNSLTPRKAKQSIPRKDPTEADLASPQSLIISSTVRLGPDPNDLPKDVSKVFSSSTLSSSLMAGNGVIPIGIKELDTFSGSVFTLSPHPSSLPLPKFSVRPKLTCTAEAAGIDAGATDNLRRLLRLR